MTSFSPQLGVCYYPEHWPEQQWADDADQMVAMGLSWVRIGEFSWSRMEKKPGLLSFEWFDRAVEVLGSAGLNVVLCTPTATPPRWMVDKYPNMLAKGEDDISRKFGSRRHYCFSHLGYREECRRITGILGERYGNNPHVKAWQIDNEYGCHDTTLSYSLSAQTAFQKWLKTKYKNIEHLNTAWGNVFWSMEYNNFSQIELPNQTVTEPNPAHVMDFRRFASDEVVAFNKLQAETLRKYTDVPLIHNYMGRITEFDHFAVGKDLDIASWDSYPLGFLEDRSDRSENFKHDYMRQGDPDFQAFHHDIYRAVGRKGWWVMEQQPGPVNWAPYNPEPLPGMVRLWTWEAIAHGAEVVSYFRWRQASFAQEQMHSGLHLPNGKKAKCHTEIVKCANEIKTISHINHIISDVAVVFDYASAWAWDTQPQGAQFDYFRLVYEYYCGLRRLGLSIDIIPSDCQDFGKRKLVIIPGLFSWNDSLRAAIKNFDGHIIIGPRTGSKTQDFQIPHSLPPGIENLQVQVTSVESLRPSAPVSLKEGGAFHIWREHVETENDIIELTEDGAPAHIQNGHLHYWTGWPDETAIDRMLGSVTEQSGLETTILSKGHRCKTIGDYTVHMNYGNEPVSIQLSSEQTYTLDAAGVLVVHNPSQKRLI